MFDLLVEDASAATPPSIFLLEKLRATESLGARGHSRSHVSITAFT